MKTGDLVVFFLVVAGLAVWIGYGMRRWLMGSWLRSVPYAPDADPPAPMLVRFLERHGYDTVCGKYKFALKFNVNGKTLQSRLYIDAVARDEDGVYVVKTARPRQKVEWTGSGVRDAFLPLFAVAGKVAGVLYVNPEEDRVQKVLFDREEQP